jgi:hypothetical protein
LEFEVHSAL